VKQPYATVNRAIWLAFGFLLESLPSEANNWTGRNGIFPAHLAQASGMTRLESELALRLLVKDELAMRRDDGRFFLTEKGRNA
jgi:hypothetical protein